MDDTPLLIGEEISKYRMLIGSAMWAVTLGRYDIMYATISMARYGCAPREGHMKAILRVFGYLQAYHKGKIIMDTRELRLQDFEVV